MKFRRDTLKTQEVKTNLVTDQVRSTIHQNLPLLASQACSIGQTLSPNKAYQNKASKASPQDRLTGQMIPFQIAKTVSFDLKNYQ